MDKARLGTIFYHNVERIEIMPLRKERSTTWHDVKINGETVITLCTNGKDLIPHVLDEETLSDDSSDS